MSWRGIFAGSLALIALQAVLSTDESAERVGGGLEWIAQLVQSALDPSVPAIPDLTGASSYTPPTDDPDSGSAGGSSSDDGFSLKPRPAPLPATPNGD